MGATTWAKGDRTPTFGEWDREGAQTAASAADKMLVKEWGL
jgi:hypothetical protein